MAFRRPACGFAALALALAGCRPGPAPLGDAELAACIPPDTVALAGVHLDAVRASPLFRQFGPGLPALLEPVRDASYLLLAYNGKDLLLIARGTFRTPPAGAVLLKPTLALAGSAAAIGGATAQHARGVSGAPALTAHAQSIAGQPVWAAVEGGVALPLTGNPANLNRLLGYTDYITLTAQLNSTVALRATGVCRSEDAALHLEETVRGLFALASTASHSRDLAGLLGSVSLERKGNTLGADLNAGPEALQQVLSALTR